jgi:hypothetical protein
MRDELGLFHGTLCSPANITYYVHAFPMLRILGSLCATVTSECNTLHTKHKQAINKMLLKRKFKTLQ